MLSMFMIASLMLSTGLMNVFASAQGSTQLQITASSDTVSAGEEVTYTITLKNETGLDVGVVGFNLDIPNSLEYMSHTIPFSQEFYMANYNANEHIFSAFGSDGIAVDEWIVMTLTCRVKSGFAGEIAVSIKNDDQLAVGDTSSEYLPLDLGEPCTVNVPKAAAGEPVAPVIESKSDTTITAVVVSGQKYMIKLASEAAPTAESSGWQDNAAFTGLEPNTAYKVYTYIPESDTVAASKVVYTEASTDKTAINDTLVPVTELTGKIYNGGIQEPTFGGVLEENADYTVSYAVPEGSSGVLEAGKPCGAGTYTVTVSGMGNYSGSFIKEFTIAAKDVSSATIADIAPITFDGKEQTPVPVVTDGQQLLEEIKDYTYSYSENTYVGTAQVTIQGTGNYQGTKTAEFSIIAADQNPLIVSSQSMTKGGNQLDLSDLVSDVMGNAAVSFEITSGNAASLTGSVLTSDRNTTGDIKISVFIAAADLNSDGKNEYNAFESENAITVTVTDKKSAQLPGGITQQGCVYGEKLSDPVYTLPDDTVLCTVMYAGTKHNGEAYAPTQDKPTEAGEYVVALSCETSDTIYSANTSFSIAPASIAEQSIVLSEASFTFDGQEKQISVESVGTLSASDYDVSGSLSGTDADEYTVTVTGKGNYQGTLQAVWRILPKQIEITGVDVTGRAYVQDNRAVTVRNVTFQGADLELNTDYSAVATMDDDNAGEDKTVTVEVTLIGRAADNYRLASKQVTTTVDISKAIAEDKNAVGAAKYGNAGNVALATLIVPGGTAVIGEVTDTGNLLTEPPVINQDQKSLEFLFADSIDNVGKTATVLINVASANYQDYTITVKLTVTDKQTQEILASNLNCVYGDANVSIRATAHGALSYIVATGGDVIDVSDTGAVTIKKAGTATVQINTEGDADYAAASKTIQVVVAKRMINIKAEDISMVVGDALPELSVNYENIPTGVNAEDIFETLAAATTEADGKTVGDFEITITLPSFTDEAELNYQLGDVTNGTLTVSARPSSGGGGGSSGGGSSASDKPAVSVSGTGGKATASGSTVTITPDAGYQIASITVNGEAVEIPADGKLTGLDKNDKVVVTFEKIPAEQPDPDEEPFTDVADSAWFADAVQYVYENGMMNGVSATLFGPDMTTNRAMIVTILHRLEGEPTAEASDFTDVADGMYYADAIDWAAANGIVNGVSETRFAPNDPITREQMAAILYRYAQFKGYDVTASADLSAFADASQISAYAAAAMQWANGAGLITGVTDTTLNPQGSATRAQVATILMRFCEDIA